jgi:RHS repeat-associated protein
MHTGKGTGKGTQTLIDSYDSLGQLTSATSTGGLIWGQSFVYDPFGSLLQQNVTSGSAPALSITVDPTTNRINTTGFTYDGAGNLSQSPTLSSPNAFSYDSENRMTRASYAGGAATNYYYGANGERLYDVSHWNFYGPDGTHLETLTTNASGNTFASTVQELHFAGRLVFQDYYPVVTDRLGSVVQMGKGNGAINQAFFPYGQAMSGLPQPANAAPPNYGTVTYPSSGSVSDVLFGTYHRDGYGLDYALNRYDDPARGRFTSPDSAASGTSARPNSWNRYSYTEGDPVNHNDPQGLLVASLDCPDAFDPLDPWDPCGRGGDGGGGGGTIGGPVNPPVTIPPGGGGGGGPAPPAPPLPTGCAVNVGFIPGVFRTPFSHAFFQVTYLGISDYIEVSPFVNPVNRFLPPSMLVNETKDGIYEDSTRGQPFWSDNGPSVCADALNIKMFSETLPPSLYLVAASNSNSFVNTMLKDAGINLSDGPPAAIGWGTPIIPYPTNIFSPPRIRVPEPPRRAPTLGPRRSI